MFSRALSTFLRKKKLRRVARKLYVLCARQARSPFIYNEFRVPDTLDGRFDAIILHVFMVLKRLSSEGTRDSAYLSQALFDALFQDMDRNLREMGVGDLSVGKHIKKMAEAYYGRAASYEMALVSEDASALKEALLRNVYRRESVSGMAQEAFLDKFMVYIQGVDRVLGSVPFSDFLEGRLIWPSDPTGYALRSDAEAVGAV